MKEYLIPANMKKSSLILGFMRPYPDLVIAIIGIVISVIGFMIIGGENMWQMIIASIPMIFCVILILPIPNYHNTLVAVQSILGYYKMRRKYVWKGWCIYDGTKK